MGYLLSETETLLHQTLRDFCEKRLAPLVEDAERDERFPRQQVLPAMADLGLLAIGVPESLGGVGGTSLMSCLVAEEVARTCGGFAIAVMAPVLAPAILCRMMGERTPRHVLDPLLEGKLLPAMAFTEPGAGSDLAAIRSTVRKTDAGLRLSGAKTFISNGPTADVFLVAAIRADMAGLPRDQRRAGLGVYVVLAGSPGVTVGRTLHKLGMRSCETGELFFEDVVVGTLGKPKAERDASTSRGYQTMLDLLDINRLYIAALSIGLAQAAFEASLAYAKDREAFGKPIGQHQAIGFKLARMATKLDAARALLQRACVALDAGEPTTRLVSEAKLFATEIAVQVSSDAVQIHGGYGYMRELPVERYFRDAKVGTIWEGTSEIQQLIICRELGLTKP